MCHHEYKEYACGHKEDLGGFCDIAKAYGPLYLKMGCINYTFAEDSKDVWRQCGKQGEGFYCAKTQDGMLIDKFRDHMMLEKHRAALKLSDFRQVTLLIVEWLQDAKARGIPIEDLKILPQFRDVVEQRAKHGRDLIGTRKRISYFTNMLNHSWNNRDMLLKGGAYTRVWSYDTFDYLNTIFPYDCLGPIAQYLPDPCPGQVAPTVAPIGNSMPQHQNSASTVGTKTNTDTALTAQAPQEPRQAQRSRLRMIQKRANVTEQDLSDGLVRGGTPEGEDPREKALRYRDMMMGHAQGKVETAMKAMGYEGIRPKAKLGRRRPGPEPTPEKNNSPSGGIKKAKSTPTRVRRSTRNVKNQPNYVDGSENSSGSKDDFPANSDAAWNDSPSKSDPAWAETPSKTNMSSSPTAPARGRKKRVTQEVTGSPNSSPAQDQQMLSSMIRGYQRRLGTAPMLAAPLFDIAQTQSDVATLNQPFQVQGGLTTQRPISPGSNTFDLITLPGEQDSAAKGGPSTDLHVHAYPQSSHTPQQRSAAIEHGALHQNLQEAMAAKASQIEQVPHQLLDSTAAVPASMVPTHVGYSDQISPLELEDSPAPMRFDYENMRRSFSSTSNITPQHSLAAQSKTANAEPLKRSMPPASQTAARKRVRLSLPGEGEVPVLEPSSSSFRFDAPAALPVDDSDVFASGIAAIERYEEQNTADPAALPTLPGNIDPRLFEELATGPQHYGEVSTGLQLYNDTGTIPQLDENTTDVSQFGAQIEQQINNFELPQVAQATDDGSFTASVDTHIPQTTEASAAVGSTPTTGDSSGLSDPPSDLSEPDWNNLLNDDVFL